MTKFLQILSILLLLSLMHAMDLKAQLRCEKVTTKEGQMELCKHAKGGIASKRFWDSAHLEGYFEAVGPEGNVLVQYDLRDFAGHASVYVTYHPNGQVHRLEYSSAPDGGIQFWNIIHVFDASGKEISKVDLSQPDGHPVLMVPEELRLTNPGVIVPAPRIPVPTFTTFVSILNSTGKKISVTYESDANDHSVAQRFELHDGEIVALDTVINEVKPHLPTAKCIQLDVRDSKRYEVQQLMSTPDQIQWIILRKPKMRKK
jgi:hypothetical protein